jgi:carboxypeptidase C (cathepsin A)
LAKRQHLVDELLRSNNDLHSSITLDFEGAAMPLRYFFLFVVSLLFIADAPPSSAQAPEQKEQKDQKEQKELFSEVDGSVTIAGKKIEYRATTGRLPVKDLTGKATAKIFFTSYTKKTDGA